MTDASPHLNTTLEELMTLTHGKPSTYKKGCRCAECTRANTEEQREAIVKRREREPYEHGSSAYNNWQCRCVVCRIGHREAVAEQHRRRKGTKPPAHGTMNAYQHYSCRCEDCKNAAREYRNSRRGKAA